MPTNEWIEVASLDDLPDGSSLEFVREGRVYALFRSGDVISCLDGLCPHQGGHLAKGIFDGSRVTCPRLGCLRWSFDVRTGVSEVGGSTLRRTYSVRLEGGVVLVGLQEDGKVP